MPAQLDLTIRRGNNVPVPWRARNADQSLFDLTGSDFVLTVALTSGRVLVRRDSAVDASLVVDVAAGTITWTPTLAESRLIPVGRLARYELERRIGASQRTWAVGDVTGVGGLGDD